MNLLDDFWGVTQTEVEYSTGIVLRRGKSTTTAVKSPDHHPEAAFGLGEYDYDYSRTDGAPAPFSFRTTK